MTGIPSASAYERHFERASLWGLLRRGHPYDFRETYDVVRELYGYHAHYVNLGRWDDPGAEPGRALAFAVTDGLDLRGGDAVVEVGSGLGQAAVDLATSRGVAVVGLNPNRRQVAFATELAREVGVADRVTFEADDAATALARRPEGSVDGVLAVECVGHLPDPALFLGQARRVLRPGRRLAFCGSFATGPLGVGERAIARATFGFVPASEAVWRDRLDAAGFVDVAVDDWTDVVLRPNLARLHGDALRPVPPAARWLVRRLIRATDAAVRDGRLIYGCFVATRGAA
jgi:SAM-dependent methyltransferase